MAAAAAEPVASTSATTDSFITSAVQGEGDSGKKRERSPAPVEAAPSKKVKFEPASDEVKRWGSVRGSRGRELIGWRAGIAKTRPCSLLARLERSSRRRTSRSCSAMYLLNLRSSFGI